MKSRAFGVPIAEVTHGRLEIEEDEGRNNRAGGIPGQEAQEQGRQCHALQGGSGKAWHLNGGAGPGPLRRGSAGERAQGRGRLEERAVWALALARNGPQGACLGSQSIRLSGRFFCNVWQGCIGWFVTVIKAFIVLQFKILI